MNKQEAYRNLVEKRKSFVFSNDLINPSSTAFDIDEIEPWAQWQNNLDAKILVIGQEFCDVDTYNRVEGTVERHEVNFEYPSNRNIHEYFNLLGFDIGHPKSPNKECPVFFTNAVMALKPGSMSANFKTGWLKESREEFLVPLIEIIQPQIIITIGTMATATVARHFGIKIESHKKMVESAPYDIQGLKFFPVYHTGGLGIRNRSKELQRKDWERIKAHLS